MRPMLLKYILFQLSGAKRPKLAKKIAYSILIVHLIVRLAERVSYRALCPSVHLYLATSCGSPRDLVSKSPTDSSPAGPLRGVPAGTILRKLSGTSSTRERPCAAVTRAALCRTRSPLRCRPIQRRQELARIPRPRPQPSVRTAFSPIMTLAAGVPYLIRLRCRTVLGGSTEMPSNERGKRDDHAYSQMYDLISIPRI